MYFNETFWNKNMTTSSPIVSICSSQPANIIIGHLDMLGGSLARFGSNMCRSPLFNSYVESLQLHIANVGADDEIAVQMKAGLAQLRTDMEALVAITGCLRTLRMDLAKANEVDDGCQYKTAAYAAQMMEDERMAGFDRTAVDGPLPKKNTQHNPFPFTNEPANEDDCDEDELETNGFDDYQVDD